MPQQTSLETYFTQVKPHLNERQQRVLDAIEIIGPATNRQIGDYLGWAINSITPRVLELREKGKVKSAYIAKDHGRSAHFWTTATEKYYDEIA